jgi:hypothetical protein
MIGAATFSSWIRILSTAATPRFCLPYSGPEVNPDVPKLGAYRLNKFN